MTRVMTPEMLAASQRGLQTLFLKLYAAADIGAWAKLFNPTGSDGAGENYPVLGATPMLAPFTGTRRYGGLRTDGFYVLNEEFDAGISVPRSAIERNKLGQYTGAITQMAADAKGYVVPLISAILANGTSADLAKCWDGEPLFSANHGKGKDKVSNIVTGSGVDTVAHVQDDIEQTIAAMTTFRDDKGKFIRGITPNLALYPSSNFGLGKILRTIKQGRTALDSADQSELLQDVIGVPELTGNDWMLAAGGGGLRPFGYQVEKDATPETAYDHDTKSVKMSVELRCAAFCADFTHIVLISNPGEES